MKRKVTFLLLLFCMFTLHAQEVYETKKDLSYIPDAEADAYRKERCKLDVYYPAGKKDFPTIVWFHGGGLEGGNKHIPRELMNRGFAVVAVNYRLRILLILKMLRLPWRGRSIISKNMAATRIKFLFPVIPPEVTFH